jgi:hypothetical protein
MKPYQGEEENDRLALENKQPLLSSDQMKVAYIYFYLKNLTETIPTRVVVSTENDDDVDACDTSDS